MVCSVCGKAFDAPAAYAPPQPQQPYAQQLYAPVPQTPAAPPKKKPKVALWVIIGIVVVVGIALALVIPRFVGQSLSSIANANTFEIDGENISSVKTVGGNGKLTSFTTGTRNGGKYNTYTYSLDSGQGLEVYAYMSHLVKSEDFTWLTDVESFDVESLSGVQCAKESRDDGYLLIVDASWNSKGYIITLVKIEGTLTIYDKPAADPDKVDDFDYSGIDPLLNQLLRSGRYYYSFRVVDLESGNEYTGYEACSGNMYSRLEIFTHSDGSTTTSRILCDKDANTFYYVYGEDKVVYRYVFEGGDYVDPSDYGDMVAYGGGTNTINGETLNYIDYDAGANGYLRFYIVDGEVYLIQYLDWDGSTVPFIAYILEISDTPPSDCFIIPDDYEIIDEQPY